MNIPHEHDADGAPTFGGFFPAPEPDDGYSAETFSGAIIATKGTMVASKTRPETDPHPWDTPQGPRSNEEMASQEWSPFLRGTMTMVEVEVPNSEDDERPVTPPTADVDTRLHASRVVVASFLEVWVPPALRDGADARMVEGAHALIERLTADDLLGMPSPRQANPEQ